MDAESMSTQSTPSRKPSCILFKGEMVRAILEDRKTQTRRIIKPQPKNRPILAASGLTIGADPALDGSEWYDADFINPGTEMRCKQGRIGDILYVKETYAETESDGGPVILYRAGGSRMHGATGSKRDGTWKDVTFDGEAGQVYPPDRWKPAIFMPRWASRITLEIVDIRAERLQDITEADAIAEGLHRDANGLWTWGDYPSGSTSPVHAYQLLWDSINREKSWDLNPFIWIIEFRRV